MMSMIQCAKPCIYQKDGYCHLDNTAPVTNTCGGCAYFLAEDRADCTFEASDRNSLNGK